MGDMTGPMDDFFNFIKWAILISLAGSIFYGIFFSTPTKTYEQGVQDAIKHQIDSTQIK